jgi:adenosylcobinamide-GDP ribazoletransferase
VAALRDTLNLFARQFALALHNSTRMRLGGSLAPPSDADADAAAVRASDAHLPGAGWVVGIAGCVSFALVALALRGSVWGPGAAAVLSTMVTVAMTGGRYESALFRAAERLEGRLPGAGTSSGYGVIALVLVLLGKTCLLASIASVSEAGVLAALLAGHVLSRLAPLAAGYWLGLGTEARSLRVGALWCAIPLLLMAAAGGALFLGAALGAAVLAGYAALRWRKKRAGNTAQEDAGALQQVCEVAFYLGAAIGA